MVRCLLCANIALAFSDSVWAQGLDGRIEFLSKCATCHGADGKGDGPHGFKLKTKPPNLTTLARRNKGVFSQRAVYDVVDGRKPTGSHRIAEMPIWGCRHAPPSSRASQKSARKRSEPRCNETLERATEAAKAAKSPRSHSRPRVRSRTSHSQPNTGCGRVFASNPGEVGTDVPAGRSLPSIPASRERKPRRFARVGVYRHSMQRYAERCDLRSL